MLLLLRHFSRVRLCVTPETAAHQAPPPLGFSRQEHWSGLPLPSPWRLLVIVMYWVLVLQVRPETFWVFPHQQREVYLKKPGSCTGAEARRLESGSPVHPQLCPRVTEVSGCLSISGKVSGSCINRMKLSGQPPQGSESWPKASKWKSIEMQLFMERWLNFQKEH